jgi:hypothetical protein
MAKLTEAQKRWIAKFLGNPSETETTVIRNRFSGIPSTVSLKFASAYNMVMSLEYAMNSRNEAMLKRIHPDLKLTNARMNFDKARYVCNALDQEAYMNLLD